MATSPFRTIAAAAAAGALVATAALPAFGAEPPGTQGAGTVTGITEPARPAFYEPPASIPSTPGTVIRTEQATRLLDPLNVNASFYDSKRVMYSSRDRAGRPIAVTGVVIVPKARWITPGKIRPLITYAPGTQGAADRCAPSRTLAEGVQYEMLFISGLLTRGYAIAMPDYQGLGTPGSHTYMIREAQAHAVLDMARAARTLPGLSSSTPVGLQGYSQGGGAVAAAAELAPQYAPELPLKGVIAGAVPADLAAVGKAIDGTMWAGFLAYSAIGMAAAYDISPSELMNPAGVEKLKVAETQCVTDRSPFAFTRSATHTTDGKPLTDAFTRSPLKEIVAENRIGNRKPEIPALVVHSLFDDVIPYSVGRQLAKDWCAKGGNVFLSTSAVISHLGGSIPNSALSYAFWDSRFAGIRQLSQCWAIR